MGGSATLHGTTSGTPLLERNIAEGYDVGGVPTFVNNRTLGQGGGGVDGPYSDIFAGIDWNPTTCASALAAFAMKAGGKAVVAGGPPHAGAVGSGAVTFASASPGFAGGANHVS